MTVCGRVQGGVVVLESPGQLPEGALVRVELELSAATDEPLVDEHGQTLGEKLLKYAGTLTGLPSDLAQHHDHYAHGTPKE